MHENKRRFIRILTKAEMTYRIVPDLKISGSISTNLSRGGLRFFVNQFIPQNSILRITVTIKEIPYSFETLAQVRWIKSIFAGEQFELGVEFKDPPREAIKQLQRYIDMKTGTIDSIIASDIVRTREENITSDGQDIYDIEPPDTQDTE